MEMAETAVMAEAAKKQQQKTTIAVKSVHNSVNYLRPKGGCSMELHCVIRPLLYCSLLVGSQVVPTSL